MTDITTNMPLHVSTDGTAGPYIMVTVGQLDEVQRLLDSRSIVETHSTIVRRSATKRGADDM